MWKGELICKLPKVVFKTVGVARKGTFKGVLGIFYIDTR